MSCLLWCGVICEAIGVLETWESAVGAFEACFLGVALVEPPPWLLSPPPLLLGLLSEPATDFLSNLRHTFLWLWRAGIVVHYDNVVQVGQVVRAYICAEGAEGHLDRFVMEVYLQVPQAGGSM